MKRVLPIVLIVLTVALVAMATIQPSELSPATSPEGAVQSLFAHVKAHDYKGAYSYVAKTGDTDEQAFARDLVRPRRQLAYLFVAAEADTKVLHASDNEALVRASLEYATAVGAFYDTRDLKVVKEGERLEGGMAGGERSQRSAAGDPGKLSALGCYYSRRGRRLGRAERGSAARAHHLDERDPAGQ